MAHDSSDEFLTGLRTLYAPSADPEWRKHHFELFSNLIAFLQSNRLTQREILKPGERPNTRTELWRSDLTDEGNRLFDTAYIKWLEALVRGRPASDTRVLERALAKIRGPGGAPVVKAPAPPPLKPARMRKRKARSRAKQPEADLSGELEWDAELEAEFRNAGPEAHDKAKWHYEGDFPKDLPRKQAFVRTGMLVGWLIEHDMITGEFLEEARRFKQGELTGAQVYEIWDGVLASDQLTEEGNLFLRDYCDAHHGRFWDDCHDILARSLPSLYHAKDTRQNYSLLRKRIEQRYREWKRRRSGRTA